MSKVLAGLGMIGVTALIVWAGASRAAEKENTGPPPQGFYGQIFQPMAGCDTKDQVSDIAAEGMKGGNAINEKIGVMHSIIDQKGEPTCVFGKYPTPLAVGEVVSLPDTKIGETPVHAWALHVGNQGGDWWVLYLALVKAESDTSI